MPKDPNSAAELAEQYRTAGNLNARIYLHQRFSRNQYGWQRWVFDQLELPANARILELGCGPGDLWGENLARLPQGWEVTLSDFSEGMLAQARGRLEGLRPEKPFEFEMIDAQARPYPLADECLDGVIANHMLYHLSERAAALAEIRRVLKPGGRLYATTVGQEHLVEIYQMLLRFEPAARPWGAVANPFLLENGAGQLAPWFEPVSLRRYEDALIVSEAKPLVDFILSGWFEIEEEQLPRFQAFVEDEIRQSGGAFHIRKDSGMFVATRKG
ncbi:MAG: class I SAM-dependent methyltransferase [Chloroflexota bacterium]